jgi:hypothetical protein
VSGIPLIEQSLLVVDDCPVIDEPVGQRVHRRSSMTNAHLAVDRLPQ